MSTDLALPISCKLEWVKGTHDYDPSVNVLDSVPVWLHTNIFSVETGPRSVADRPLRAFEEHSRKDYASCSTCLSLLSKTSLIEYPGNIRDAFKNPTGRSVGQLSERLSAQTRFNVLADIETPTVANLLEGLYLQPMGEYCQHRSVC